MTVETIATLRDLCDYVGCAHPSGLSRRMYKDTECGASLSFRLARGDSGLHSVWYHSGDAGRLDLTGTETLLGFSIQTIVEGSEVTIDSDEFIVPVDAKRVDDFIADMEAAAAAIFAEANGEDRND
jgi:hypothetical protein